MSNRDAQIALDRALESMTALTEALDHAANRAVEIGATDMLTRITAAKAATRRGTHCLTEIGKDLQLEILGHSSSAVQRAVKTPRT